MICSTDLLRDFKGRRKAGVKVFVARAIVAGVALVFNGVASAQTDKAQLEMIYRGWASSMETKNYRMWQRNTATYRQIITYNMVVSRKDPWPGAIFSLPFRLPEISTLTYLATLEMGDTANMVYFGKVDFGVLDRAEVPENLLMLKFVKENGVWKFDNTRFFNLKDNPEVLHMARIKDLTFLQDERFQPNGVVPEPAQILETPDYVGELWIVSVGYETTVRIGDLHQSRVENNALTEVVLGGLLREGRPINVATRKVDAPEGVEPRLEIGVYALRNGKPAVRVWHFKPEEVPESFDSKVYANAVTIPGG